MVDKTITENGEYNPVDDEADGYSFVTVEVEPILEDINVTPSTNAQTITHGENYDGIGTVSVEAVNLEDINVTPTTSSQTINAGENYLGIGTVSVNAVTASIDENITAENIKKDVEILGVTGSYEGSGGGNATLETTGTEFDYVSDYMTLLTNIDIPDGVTSIGDDAFSACSFLTSVTIPNSVTTIGINAFHDCSSLTSIIIPNSVTSIGTNAFQYCSALLSITIPNGITSIEGWTFESCEALTSITIPNSVTSIGDSAFNNCSALISIIIPNLVESIGDYAFSNCTALTSITIGNSVTSIGEYAFENCAAVESMEFLSTTPPDVTSGAFDYFSGDCIIYVPNGTLSAYTSAPNYPDPSTYTYIERPAT